MYVVEFNYEGIRVEVLKAGPWSFDNHPLIVKPWSMDANLVREDMVEVPVWVRFSNLKLHLWLSSMLSKMANVVEKLLFTEKMTAERERLAYARLYIEVRVGMELLEIISMQDEEGKMWEHKLKYEWNLMSCSSFGVFGYTIVRYPKKPKVMQQWVPKNVVKNVEIVVMVEDTIMESIVEQELRSDGLEKNE